MATNPYFTQLHTQRFTLVGAPLQRDGFGLKDQRFLNMYPELIPSPISEGKKYYLKKRPGLELMITQAPGRVGNNGRGVWWWNQTIYSVVGNTLYANGNGIYTFSTTTGPIGFVEWLYQNGTVNLMVSDGTTIVQIDVTNTPTILSGYPIPHVPALVFLDGYLFVAALNSNIIWNCTLNDPTTWPNDQFISAEMYGATIQTIVKSNNYLACVTNVSVEWFYDNANATGSPLQRNAPAVSQFGTPAGTSVNQTEQEVILVGDTGNGGHTVWLIQGFQPTEVGTAPVREILDAEGAFINAIKAFTIQVAGHKFYVLNLVSQSRTLVYDFDEKMWHEWTSGPGQTVFQCSHATNSASVLGYVVNGSPILQDDATGVIFALSPQNYTDNFVTILCQVQTLKIDFDTIKRKRFNRLTLIGDSPNGEANCLISVQFSDDDYNTWSPQPGRSLLLNADYSTITNLGLARRRAFRFTFQQSFPLRLEAMELDVIQEVRR